MSNIKITISALFLLIFLSCAKEPDPINFGKDQCDHCKMTIMDKKFGAELITDKGKVYKFDAAECMINFLNENKDAENSAEKILVINMNEPGQFTNALKAVYLISPKIKSPMGENISSFSENKDAQVYSNQFGGEILNWEQVKNKVLTGN